MNSLWERLGVRSIVPNDKPLVVLVRHAERYPIPPGDPGNEISLTPQGFADAKALGRDLGSSLLGVVTSPVPRCVQTAHCICEGAALILPVELDRGLGDPGVYVEDDKKAWETLQSRDFAALYEGLATRQMLPGFSDPWAATLTLATTFKRRLHHASTGVQAFITHDLILATFVAHATNRVQTGTAWPTYLSGAAIWDSDDDLIVAYQDSVVTLRWRS